MLVINARWFVRQVKNFQPFNSSQMPPVIGEIPSTQ
jgi:hypothetical protein